MIVPETSSDGARILAERIREAVAATAFSIPGDETIQISISIGVAAFPQVTDSPEALVDAADVALYEAKQSGRNRVCSSLAMSENAG
jgi:diguanylate cyclase